MDRKLNAKCDICGNRYHVCNTCEEIKSFKPWRIVTDTFNHYMIFLALSNYTKTKDKNKAKIELENCDLTGLENFNSNIKSAIDEIMQDNTLIDTENNSNLDKKTQRVIKGNKQNKQINENIE